MRSDDKDDELDRTSFGADSSGSDFPGERNEHDERKASDERNEREEFVGDYARDYGDLTDEQVDKAFADIESLFGDELSAGVANLGGQSDDTSVRDTIAGENDIDPLEAELFFNEELQEILGNTAQMAVIMTQIADPEFLAALCKLCEFDATCIRFEPGTAAVLHNCDNGAPEEAVKVLTDVMAGLSAVLFVNRASKITSKIWMDGKEGDDFPPLMVLSPMYDDVEDLLVGIQGVEDFVQAGLPVAYTSDFATVADAVDIIKKYLMPFPEWEPSWDNVDGDNDEDDDSRDSGAR